MASIIAAIASSGPDGIAGNEQHAVFDAIADEGSAVRREEIVQVISQLERCERVLPVRAHELASSASLGAPRDDHWATRPEEHRRRRDEGQQHQPAHHERRPVDERQRNGPPREQVRGLTTGELDARIRAPCNPDGGDARGNDSETANVRGEYRPTGAKRLVLNVEGLPAVPERGRQARRERCLFDVETLEDVYDREENEHDDRDLQGPPAAAVERGRGETEHDAGGDRNGMEDRQRRDRLEPEQQMTAPADVRRHGRDGVHGRDDECPCSRDQREVEPPPESRSGMEMAAEAAMDLGVAPAREEIPPVLDHEPDCGSAEKHRLIARTEQPEPEGDGLEREQPEAESNLVDSLPEHVHPRSQRVRVDPDQPDRGDPPPTGPVGQA